MKLRIKLSMVAFIVFLVFGVLLRFYYAGTFIYENHGGDFIPSNPDGLFWLNDEKPRELWAELNPLDNEYFSLVCFLGVIVIGFVFINLKGIHWLSSSIWAFFMLFSKYLYTKGSIGFYDHDYLGMFFFMLLLLIIYFKFPYVLLAPILLYLIQHSWSGLLPVAGLLMVIIFLEYFLEKLWYLKYFVYLLLTCVVIMQTFNPFMFVTETLFRLSRLIIIIPFLLIGLNHKDKFWNGVLIFSSIVLLHSSRTVIIAYPLIFLAFCMFVKDKYKGNKLIVSILLIYFLITQVGMYVQLDRFGTNLSDEGLYYLRDHTEKDSIILSWWDYGYYVEYLGKRSAMFKGNAKATGLKELSTFYCNGSLPSYSFDYFVHFVYDPNIFPALLNFNGNKCNTIHNFKNDDRLRLEYSNKDIEIYRRLGI